jgi:gamma-glutamylcyclotransferase (GGCT)/AIG2-like uncharacterized protein YtfP
MTGIRSTMSPPLFVYGTLLSAQIRERVLGRAVPVRTARLTGYRRLALAGRSYPGLVRALHGQVTGLLVEGLGKADLRQLDRYEGQEYRRRLLRVDTPSGRQRAWVYLPRPEVAVSDTPWVPPEG